MRVEHYTEGNIRILQRQAIDVDTMSLPRFLLIDQAKEQAPLSANTQTQVSYASLMEHRNQTLPA